MISPDPSHNPENLDCALPVCRLNRRHFLQALAAAAGVALLNSCGEDSPEAVDAAVAAQAIGSEFKIPGAQKLKAGEALAFTLPDQTPGLIFLSSSGQPKALSAKCTHAGCTVQWQSNAELSCPCHGSRFDLGGKVLTGPATEPLPLYAVRRQGEDVLIKVA